MFIVVLGQARGRGKGQRGEGGHSLNKKKRGRKKDESGAQTTSFNIFKYILRKRKGKGEKKCILGKKGRGKGKRKSTL